MENKKKTLGQWRRMMWFMSRWHIPMIGYVSPKLEHIDDHEALVSIRLRRRTKNHLNSMYFGALAIGGDITAGLHVFYFSNELGIKPSFSFRSMNANFYRRANGTVWFMSNDGQKVRETVLLAKETGERQHALIHVEAKTVEGEPIATFEMEISVKAK